MKGGAQDQSGLLAIEGEEAQEAGEVALMSAAARPSRKRWSSVAGSLAALGIVLCLLRARVLGPESHTLKETALSNVASLAGHNETALSNVTPAQLAEPVHNETTLRQSIASPPPASDPQASTLDCGYVPNANIDWTGKETVTFVGTETDAWQSCCDECKAKADENPPCAAWVYIYDGSCYQKYDTGIGVTTIDSSSSDAGILTASTPAPTAQASSFIGELGDLLANTGASIQALVQTKFGELLAAVSGFFQSLIGSVRQAVPSLAGSCSGIEPTHHYPLPGETYTHGLPSPLVAHPSGMTMCDVETLQQDCVEQINAFRAGAPFSDGRSRDHGHLDPLQLAPEDFRKCMNEKASSDLLYSYKGKGCGHWTFGLDCGQNGFRPGTENSCCTRSCDGYDDCKQTLIGCLQQMWDEGMIVLDTGNTDWGMSTGHYWNMLADAEYVACGFGFDSDGGMLATQSSG